MACRRAAVSRASQMKRSPRDRRAASGSCAAASSVLISACVSQRSRGPLQVEGGNVGLVDEALAAAARGGVPIQAGAQGDQFLADGGRDRGAADLAGKPGALVILDDVLVDLGERQRPEMGLQVLPARRGAVRRGEVLPDVLVDIDGPEVVDRDPAAQPAGGVLAAFEVPAEGFPFLEPSLCFSTVRSARASAEAAPADAVEGIIAALVEPKFRFRHFVRST